MLSIFFLLVAHSCLHAPAEFVAEYEQGLLYQVVVVKECKEKEFHCRRFRRRRRHCCWQRRRALGCHPPVPEDDDTQHGKEKEGVLSASPHHCHCCCHCLHSCLPFADCCTGLLFCLLAALSASTSSSVPVVSW